MFLPMFLGLETWSLKRMHCSMSWSFKFDDKSLNRGVTAVTDASWPLWSTWEKGIQSLRLVTAVTCLLRPLRSGCELSNGHYVSFTPVTTWWDWTYLSISCITFYSDLGLIRFKLSWKDKKQGYNFDEDSKGYFDHFEGLKFWGSQLTCTEQENSPNLIRIGLLRAWIYSNSNKDELGLYISDLNR